MPLTFTCGGSPGRNSASRPTCSATARPASHNVWSSVVVSVCAIQIPSCFSRCLRVPIAIRRFYEQCLWIPQTLLPRYPDLHHRLLGLRTESFLTTCALEAIAPHGRSRESTKYQGLTLAVVRMAESTPDLRPDQEGRSDGDN